jgi:predicted extracellular nuclease
MQSSSIAYAAGTISLTTAGTAYTQDFNTLANSGTSSTVPNGWDFYELGTNRNITYTAGTGSSLTGDTYSFGSTGSTERAFGGLRSGSLNPTIGANFTNNTGVAITSLAISFTGEQWRAGVSGRNAADALYFQLSTNATSVITGTWTSYTALNYNSTNISTTVGLLDGNAAANRTFVAATITGLNITNGASFWIHWTDSDITGADDALAIDDFSLTPNPIEVAPSVISTTPANGATNVTLTSNLTVIFSEAVNVSGTWYNITCTTSGAHTATVSGGPTTFTLNPSVDFSNGETCTVTLYATQITDQDTNDPPDTMTSNTSWSFSTPPPTSAIRDIQGTSHISTRNGIAVSNIPGIVTALKSNGFYMQDPSPDSDPATSEGIFVFTSSAPTVAVGDSVLVSGTVSEYRDTNPVASSLTLTEIASPVITVQSSGNALPAAIVIGTGGRIPPTTVIEDDSTGNVETSNTFDPTADGIDFYESLEGMRVQVNNPVVVGPSDTYGEIFVLADDGANASMRTTRGGIIIQATDYNPERIVLDNPIVTLPTANVGDHFTTSAVGILSYSDGNYKLEITQALTLVASGQAQEVTTLNPTSSQISVATFNVENLDPNDPATKFDTLADLVVNHLLSPDLIAVEEIQDNNGATNDAVVDASTTFSMLIAAIQTAGGPTYSYRQINPVDDQDGGEGGGNIRQAFLFRTDRGLSFIDRAGAGSSTANAVVNNAGSPILQYSPGRIDPTNTAFSNSRKPLAGEFLWNARHFFVIANHFNSKGGDDALFGYDQPPVLSSAVQRNLQAQVVNDFVDQILAIDANADVIVLGDLNDFEFSTPIATLKGTPAILNALVEKLSAAERYTYVYQGNSQAIDHILVSNDLWNNRYVNLDIVHVNSEFATQASDHEPQVALFNLTGAPTAVKLSSFAAHSESAQSWVWWLGWGLGSVGFGSLILIVRRRKLGRV